ncbi:hypothetical protein [Streptoalloteichus hindustanus]|uniref:Uncharacterized protein n=1 Tax=Streptoalloteichus hindustanus TaxID=2017 RepID=A0A1M5GHN2_STRHI|nr:hypothetical protein [Streptoalloteichus hindustanus]SHG03223.1 hypothetical protein SAMN05444320_106127 [Streptoalloteichus hindustanus]
MPPSLVELPAALAVALVLLRSAPSALLTLVAGVVAVWSRDTRRAERALTVLHTVRSPRGSRRRAAGRARRREAGPGGTA